MDYCPVYFEVNADISHYNFRQITRGGWLQRILSRVGHTHQRMARQLGESKRLVVESPWSQFTSECQRF